MSTKSIATAKSARISDKKSWRRLTQSMSSENQRAISEIRDKKKVNADLRKFKRRYTQSNLVSGISD